MKNKSMLLKLTMQHHPSSVKPHTIYHNNDKSKEQPVRKTVTSWSCNPAGVVGKGGKVWKVIFPKRDEDEPKILLFMLEDYLSMR